MLTQGTAGGTPWHPHHVAERYGLFAIIVLGEGVVGTVASSGDLLGGGGGTHWTWNAVAVVIAGVGPTFAMWWMYFLLTAILLAAAGVTIAVCLRVVMLAPFVTVIGYETIGHRHQQQMLEELGTE